MENHINLHYEHATPHSARKVIRRWPAASRKVADTLIERYGPPHEVSPSMLIWLYNGNWKRTVIHRNGAAHNVPHPHKDILEQTVDAKVLPADSSEIMKFNGSIIIDRTRGEMTAFCESEQANIFLLNLAHDICIGRKTAQEAKSVLMDSSDFFHSMLPNQYRDSLLFTSTVETNDPDMVTAEPN